MKNPYEVLGLDKNASLNDIKTSYKKQALKHHPDRGGDQEIFKELSEAYSILSDPQKKENYDRFGSIDNSNININDIINNMFGFGDINIDDILNDINNNSFQSNSKPKVFVKIHTSSTIHNPFENILNLNNIFDDIINDSPSIKNNKPKPKYDNIEVKVNLEEIINSSKRKIKYTIKDLCPVCKHFMITCLNCNGLANNCYSCNGNGIMITKKVCKSLNCVNGIYDRDVEINIEIPKGVKEEHIFQLRNKGSYDGRLGTYNHLKIKIKYDLPKQMHIYGNSIFFYVDLKLEELLCGFTKKIKYGKTEFDINMKTYFDPSEALVYKEMGIPVYKDESNKGDLVVKFNIIYPKNDNEIMKKYTKVFKKIFST